MREAKHVDYRDVDDCVNKYYVCDLCWNLKDYYWREIHDSYGSEEALDVLREIYYDDIDKWKEWKLEPPKLKDWKPVFTSTKLLAYLEDGTEVNISDYVPGSIYDGMVNQILHDLEQYPDYTYPDEWAEYWEEYGEENELL